MTRLARFTVFDAQLTAERINRHIAAHAHKAERLHLVGIDHGKLPGGHRMLREDGITVDLFSAAIDKLVPELGTRFDALYVDGVSEAGTGWIRGLSKLCQPNAELHAQEQLTAAQTKAFEDTGFRFSDSGNGGGQHAVYTSRKPQPAAPPLPERSAVVIGAGIAGCAIAERLTARGWHVTLVERHPLPASEASGNLAGIFMPLLSRDDNISTRLTRAAFLFTLRYWDHIGADGHTFLGQRCGVLQVARDAAHARVQRQIAEHWGYPPDYAQWFERDEAGELLGHPAPDGGWLFPQAGWARPASVCEAMLSAAGDRVTRIFNTGTVTLKRVNDEWHIENEEKNLVASAATVIIANGAGALELDQTARLPLARVRGQVTHLDATTVPNLPCVVCREAYMTPAVEGVVSTGATYDDIADPLLLPSSHHENIRKARSLLGEPALGTEAPLAGRVGFRCIPPDRLPLVGPVPDHDSAAGQKLERLRDVPRHPGLYALLGYASRGLIWSPYCAEILAAQLEGEPLPLENKLRDALDPGRFVLAKRKRHTPP
ncbi:FAD-dependent oxidoreductase [Massilia arenosa]|uniref:FAD-dependent oxidoreductase n=1 Tax=Zemynaea arenosa TaxID=2561931 RepID=A0A4Y9SBE8_9BURK|nr:FAD-dependent 5-carboxymethylaminomethyl-2-thiouridine(34) oxidoreductase MnmC [Massilia arenosa]TFW17579.1 FAD-dependent oxidoreductase [Massilia arenosa]